MNRIACVSTWAVRIARSCVLVCLAGCMSTVLAQTPVLVTPSSGISFTPSPDHNATVTVGGTVVNVVTTYVLVVHQGTTATGPVAFTLDLGKPTPVSGSITVKPVANFGGLAQGSYVATVTANGSGGSAVSPLSDPFARVNPPAATGKPTVVP